MLALMIAAQVAAFNAAPPNAVEQKPAFAGQTRAPEMKAGVAYNVQTVAAGLELPWAMAFLPDGQMLVTERPGRLRIVRKGGTLSVPVAGLLPVDYRRQGGLLDVALHPQFMQNGLIYWSYAEKNADGTTHTAVARGRLVDGAEPKLEGVTRIFRQVPSLESMQHYGSRLVFAPDGTLFVTLGDRSVLPGRVQAQNPESAIGKLVRINADGSVPKDNPFVGKKGVRPEIWSIGHRSAQGAALHPVTGELWENEHGPRGGDEVNIVRKGLNYGWPTITYGQEYSGEKVGEGKTAQAGLEQPVYYWDPIVAPSGMAFYTGALFPAWKGSLFIGGLRSTALIRLTLDGNKVIGEERLLAEARDGYGGERVRDVRQGPDGALYVLTESDGKVLRLAPADR